MGLTSESVGINALDRGIVIQKHSECDRIFALAGNPNVGKSTVFNALTGLRQHTGNWAGKTVSNATGMFTYKNRDYIMVDIPGTYSLSAHSKEEEIARDFICFGESDGVIVVCDATCLERNLNLVLQTIEITPNVIVCVNLMDEAEKKSIHIDLEQLSAKLGVPVIGTSARNGKGMNQLISCMEKLSDTTQENSVLQPSYTAPTEEALAVLTPALQKYFKNPRWLALRLLEENESFLESILKHLPNNPFEDEKVCEALRLANVILAKHDISKEQLRDNIVSCLILCAEEICCGVVSYYNEYYQKKDRMIDRILTSRLTGIPIMLLLLGIVFWITISGANYPSALLSNLFAKGQHILLTFFVDLGVPALFYEPLIFGVYRVVSWVIAVMLPPMAIFFPLFTLLEDLGYLPRIAFNLDHTFSKCSACGKQALTMCMGFGCNAAGIVGCRIIDSPRERLIAALTNCFVPCNGRFPTLIAMISMFITYTVTAPFQPFLGALVLTGVVLFGIMMTFLVSALLSKTFLKGQPSSFTLELPPYRRPHISRIILRSVLDRTLFVLGRSVAFAAPAGLFIWLFANISIGNTILLTHCSTILDPFAKIIGLDGVILLAFLLGMPANEIVIPIILMTYLGAGSLLELESLTQMRELFSANGWTWVTAINVMLFSLMHWPCATTLLTIRKETGSWKWTLLSALIPTICGILVCFLFTQILDIFNL